MPFGAGGEFVGGGSPPAGGGSGGGAITGTSLDIDSPSGNPTGIQITDDSGQVWSFHKTDSGDMEFISDGGEVLWQATGGNVQLAAPDGTITISNAGSNGSITIDAGSGGTGATLLLICDGDGGIQMYDNGTNPGEPTIMALRLPTSDPGTTGQLWNDAGTVKVSA